jgi:c-di-AMP phosphodiesterase-like protein
MCYEQKLNAITRLIILITILGYISTMSTRILVIGFLTLAVIFVLYKMRKQKLTKDMMKEGFFVEENNLPGVFKQKSKVIVNPVTLDSVLSDEFKEGTKRNPFSNVLLTQINDEPDRKSAPPAFNVSVDEDITKNVKRSVQMMNPGIKNTNKQLYGDLWQNFLLDDSNRVFYSTSNTRVEPGDQSSFGEYLYGNMPSSKGSDFLSAVQREKDSYRYTLY